MYHLPYLDRRSVAGNPLGDFVASVMVDYTLTLPLVLSIMPFLCFYLDRK